MESINSQVVTIMMSGGVSPQAVENYKQLLPTTADNLESIGCFWSQRVAQLNVNIRTYADVCIYLRDTSSELLWLNFFRERVVPIIKEHQLLESRELQYG